MPQNPDRPGAGYALSDVVNRMREPPVEGDYYALTLSMTPDMQVYTSVQSSFVRWESQNPPREIRKARVVGPSMAKRWKAIGQDCWTVTDVATLFLFHLLGGNALVAVALAEKHVPDWVGERVVGQRFMAGFVNRPERDKHAPTPKQRMRVLRRDGFRCRTCGRTPDSGDVHVHLEVHHITPWEEGGLTIDDNLITMCSTCHAGLEPHFDPALFGLIGHDPLEAMSREQAEFDDNCRRYREHAIAAWLEAAGRK